MTGVHKIISLSLMAALLSLSGFLEAADAMDPIRRLLVSLITERLLLWAWECWLGMSASFGLPSEI